MSRSCRHGAAVETRGPPLCYAARSGSATRLPVGTSRYHPAARSRISRIGGHSRSARAGQPVTAGVVLSVPSPDRPTGPSRSRRVGRRTTTPAAADASLFQRREPFTVEVDQPPQAELIGAHRRHASAVGKQGQLPFLDAIRNVAGDCRQAFDGLVVEGRPQGERGRGWMLVLQVMRREIV